MDQHEVRGCLLCIVLWLPSDVDVFFLFCGASSKDLHQTQNFEDCIRRISLLLESSTALPPLMVPELEDWVFPFIVMSIESELVAINHTKI